MLNFAYALTFKVRSPTPSKLRLYATYGGAAKTEPAYDEMKRRSVFQNKIQQLFTRRKTDISNVVICNYSLHKVEETVETILHSATEVF